MQLIMSYKLKQKDKFFLRVEPILMEQSPFSYLLPATDF